MIQNKGFMYFEIYIFSYGNAYSCTNFYNFSGKGLTSSVSVNLEILAFLSVFAAGLSAYLCWFFNFANFGLDID